MVYNKNDNKDLSFNGYFTSQKHFLKEKLILKRKEFYDDGELKFEGEYLNGKRNGKGKEYYENGKLQFEGDYYNGKRWNGKLYYKKGHKVIEIQKGKQPYDEDEDDKFIMELDF